MTHLLLTQDEYRFNSKQIETLKEWGYLIKTMEEFSMDDMSWPEVIVGTTGLNLESLEIFENLKLIQLNSAGYNYLNLSKLKEHGIKVANARGAYSVQIAEYILAKVLAVYKNLRMYDASQKQGEWNRDLLMSSLVNQEVAILGTGSIGQEVAKRFKSFDTLITGFNTTGKPVDYFDKTHELNHLSKLINAFDIIIICLPLNEDTRQLFDDELLTKMKASATLVNIGRGKIIKEDDLLAVLDNHLRAVILDVFEKEPLPKESPLWNHPKSYVSAHIAYLDNTAINSLHSLQMKNLRNYIFDKPLNNLVN